MTTTSDVVNRNDFETSLREAVDAANSMPGADTITFTADLAGETITLDGSQIEVTDSVTIQGLGADQLTISGLDQSRIFSFGSDDDATYTIADVTLTDGEVARGDEPSPQTGGAIFLNNPGDTLIIERSVISSSASNGGGAVYVEGAGAELQISDSALVDNEANFNGSAVLTVGGVTTTIVNSTVSGNTSLNNFAALAVQTLAGQSADMTLRFVTVNDNIGEGLRASVFSDATANITVSNSIVASSSLRNLFLEGSGASFTSLGNNIFDDASVASVLSSDLINTDPLLGPLADNGGPTPTHALLFGSDAIDRGNNAMTLDIDNRVLTTDQRGETFDRIQFNIVDIGAFESNTETPSLIVTTASDVSDQSDSQTSLREAINFANSTPEVDTITFVAGLAGETITLSGSQLEITESVTIEGLGVDQLTISGNDASRVFVIDDDNDNTEIDVTLRGLTIRDGNTTSGSSALTGSGAGIQNKENLTLENVAVRSNRSDLVSGNIGSRGGGLAHSLGNLVVTASTFADNSSLDSGGIDIASGSAQIINSTFYGNTVRGNGAAIRVEGDDTTVTIRNSTITGNIGDDNDNGTNQAGGIQRAGGSVTLHNTIVAGNFGGTDGEINDLAGEFASDSSHNLIGEQDSGVSLNNGTNRNIVGDGGSGARAIDSILDTQITAVSGFEDKLEFFLISNSPAVNNGSNAQAIGVDGNPLTTDQFDNARVQGGTVDIGSRESSFVDVATAPVITNIVRDEGGVLARPDLINTYAVTFDQDVDVSPDDLLILNQTTGFGFFADSLSYDSSSRTATWDLGSLSLSAAFYTFQLSDSISAVAGGLSLDGNSDGTGGDGRDETVYIAIPGDANLDGDVEVNEINIFLGTNTGDGATVLSNLDRPGTFTWSQGDFNGDGDVDANQLNIFNGVQSGDYAIFLANLGRSVLPANFQPVIVQPVTAQPATAQPVITQPLLAQPVTVNVSGEALAAGEIEANVSGAIPAASALPLTSPSRAQTVNTAPVSVAPVTLSATSSVAIPTEAGTAIQRVEAFAQTAPSVLESELPASTASVSQPRLNSAQANVENLGDLSEATGLLKPSAETNIPEVVTTSLSQKLEGSLELIDLVFSEDIDAAKYDTSADSFSPIFDDLEEAWLAFGE